MKEAARRAMQISTLQTVCERPPVGAISATAVGCYQPGNVWRLGVSRVTRALMGLKASMELRFQRPQCEDQSYVGNNSTEFHKPFNILLC